MSEDHFSTNEKFVKYRKSILNLPVETVLEEVRLGKRNIIAAVHFFETPEELAYRRELVDGGLIQIILGFLKQCEHSTLTEIFGEDADDAYADKRDKIIPSPLVWLMLLSKCVMSTRASPQDNSDDLIPGKNGDPICVEIAEGIGPLIKCMRDDQTRKLFKSDFFWYDSYAFFIILMAELVHMNNKALPVLLQYENGGFIEMIIQHLFIDEYRPDIMEDELAEKLIRPHLAGSTLAAARFLSLHFLMLAKDNNSCYTNKNNKTLYKIGVTPVVNEAFDPNCNTSFMSGVIDLVEKSGGNPESKRIYYYLLLHLTNAGCVGSDIIRKVIKLGMEQPDELDAECILKITFRLLHVATQGRNSVLIPDDSRFATAIDSGLLEMVLKFLVVHGSSDSDPGDGIDCLHSIAKGASSVSTHPKSSSAITNDVCTKVANSMAQPELINLVQSNEKAMAVYKAIGFLVDPDFKPAIKCSSCATVLKADAIKRCSKCKNATYCSKNCQAAHWKKHKQVCKVSKGTSMYGVPQQHQDVLETQSLSLWGPAYEMVKQNLGPLLTWSILNDYDILECMVIVNFCTAPPTFEMKLYSDFIHSDQGKVMFTENARKDIEQKVLDNEALMGVIIFLPAAGSREGNRASIGCAIPGKGLNTGSWRKAQAEHRRHMISLGWRRGLPFP